MFHQLVHLITPYPNLKTTKVVSNTQNQNTKHGKHVISTNRQMYQTGKIITPLNTNDVMSLLSRHSVKQPKVMLLAVIIKHIFKNGEEEYKVDSR